MILLMSDYYTVPGTDNVVDLKKYRTYKECFIIYNGYKQRLSVLKAEDIEFEKTRLLKEVAEFPNHILTKVKILIFEKTTGSKL
jgi:hypothetical protein